VPWELFAMFIANGLYHKLHFLSPHEWVGGEIMDSILIRHIKRIKTKVIIAQLFGS